MRSRFLALRSVLLLTFLWCTISIAAHDFEVEGIYYNINGNTVTVTYQGESYQSKAYYGIVTIPETVTYDGLTFTVISIGEYAFSYCKNLNSVTIPNSVTSIGNNAFLGCTGLTSMIIPNSVTSISSNTFRNCYNLTNITIPNSVTTIGDHAFDSCRSLNNVEIPNSVSSIGSSAFEMCNSLTSITIPSSIKEICSSTFSYCYGLTCVSIPNSVTTIGSYAFQYTGLNNLTIPNSVTTIGSHAFYHCSSLKSVNLPNSITSIGEYAFSYSGLTAVTIPTSVARIGEGAFFICNSMSIVRITDLESWCKIEFENEASNPLYNYNFNSNSGTHLFIEDIEVTDLLIPNTITSISNYAFNGCDGLRSVTIPSSVTTIGHDSFRECMKLSSVSLPQSITTINYNTFIYCYNLASIEIPNSVTFIGGGSFKQCTSLASINIPNSVKTIGSEAFSGCTNLTSVVLPNSVTIIGNDSFYRCTSLASIDIPNSVTEIGSNTFLGCENLTSVVLPNSVSYIGEKVFYGCTSLTSVIIPNSVTNIYDQTFSGCSSLVSVTIPNSVKNIHENAFSGCSALIRVNITDISAWCKINFESLYANPLNYAHSLYLNGTELTDLKIPNGITSIGRYSFSGYSRMTSIEIPNSVKTIGTEAFSGCENLTNLVLPNSVTTIYESAFSGCTRLPSVTIPETVTNIDSYVFNGCTELIKVICMALDPPKIRYATFNGLPSDFKVYVPPISLEVYQSADYWKNYTILPIKDGANLNIKLPDSADVSQYANMKLAIINRTDEKTNYYTLTDKQTYTFYAINLNSSWDVTLTNQYSDELGRIEDVEIGEEDVTVTFPSLKQPQTVTLMVKTPNGQDVTAQAKVSWKDENGELLVQSNQIAGLPAGRKLNYSVTLPQELATAYALPADMNYTVKDGDNTVVCQMTAIAKVKLSGIVKEATSNQSIYGASISATQSFAGGNSNTLTTTTDNQGLYTLVALSAPTTLTVTAQGYITQTVNCDDLMTGDSNVTLPDVALNPITGAVVNVNLTYTPAHAEDESAETQNWYSDYQNVDYEVYNKTTGHAITNISVQYPQIVLLEDVNDGDVLELTACSRKDAFMPVKTSATIAEQRATATFNIYELGKIAASFKKNTNPNVTGIIYDEDNKLLKSSDFTENELFVDGLNDGNHKLITMGKSEFYNSIYDMDQFENSGLEVGIDYAVNTVQVKSGIISNVIINEVPFLDESKLYYTGEQTSFSVNKSNVIIGYYLTFRAQVDFKEQYADKVSDVRLIIDLPESCQFYENSVLVGDKTGGYSMDGKHLIIPLSNYNDIVRFCAIPTVAGDYSPCAFVQFSLDGSMFTQPIGTVFFSANFLSIDVPLLTAEPIIPVKGYALNGKNVRVYDGNVLVGQTQCMANHTWKTSIFLHNPTDNSSHFIHAEVETIDNFVLLSDVKEVKYRKEAPILREIDMIYKDQTIIFDYKSQKVSPNYYIYQPGRSCFTFIAWIDNGTPNNVHNLYFKILDNKGHIRTIAGTYDYSICRWICSDNFNMNSGLPINVSIVYNYDWGDERYYFETGFSVYYQLLESLDPCIDPSGYVYEAVPSNRLEDVIVTCYYRDENENVVLWDAEQYGQENPLLTDENGYYRWDVPIGMWQVKYEKEGYETTYSDWLPVPPPQLDVNIGMVQMRQPEVIKARAYPKAVEFEFDKFMFPETLNSDNITVTVNGSPVIGTIELLNAEVDDPLAITSIRRAPGTGLTFASKVRFNAYSPFNVDKVTLHVKKDVKSYADLQMNEDYETVLDVELEIQSIETDSAVNVLYGDSRALTVSVVPASASKGKTLTVRSVAPMIATTDAETYTLDNNGQAVITVHGDLPGMTSLLYGIDGYDLSAATLVNVMMESQMTVATPTATIASGSEVVKGTAVYLRCSTPGATIYYTLDGSCPCDNTPARKVYDGNPIIIDCTMTIKAMATAPDLYDSDVATFVYRVNDGLKGDVNNDGEVNIADINAVINIILGKPVDPDYLNRADVNRDDEINISDINEIIKIILYGSNKINMKVNCNDRLHLNDLEMKPGEVRTLNVTLDNSSSYSALQCDIELPAGLTLVDVRAANGELTKVGEVNESTSRAMTYSMNGCRLGEDGQAVLLVTVRADASLGLENQIFLKNVVLADNSNKAWRISDCEARVNNASGIEDISAGNDRVWVEGKTLCLFSHQSGTVRLVDINGVQQLLDINAGLTRLEVASGVYVIVMNGKSYKIAVK